MHDAIKNSSHTTVKYFFGGNSIHINLENDWLHAVNETIDGPDSSDCPPWAAFRAKASISDIRPAALASFLPLFHHSANSVAMIRHCLTVVTASVAKLDSVVLAYSVW